MTMSSAPPLDLPPSPDAVVDSLRNLVSDANAGHDPATLTIRAGALAARLKALNRTANAATRARKQASHDARDDMDQAHLRLQNLLYEKRHLEREIDKCRQFATIYQDIPLYSIEEFVQLAPPESRTEEILADEHQLMLTRLSFELAERQRLEKRKKDMQQLKDGLQKQTKVYHNAEESMKQQVEALAKVALEGQKKVAETATSVSASRQPSAS